MIYWNLAHCDQFIQQVKSFYFIFVTSRTLKTLPKTLPKIATNLNIVIGSQCDYQLMI